MRVALTGSSGIVGGFVAQAMRRAGHDVTMLSRATGYQLGDSPDLTGHDAVIHCAFAHVPGKYRGGEGDDPEGFLAANLDGSYQLFDAALRAKVRRVLFLSSRAVHDGYPAGTALADDLPAAPTTFYGRAKAGAEAHLASLPLLGTSLRATGIYGPGPANKWRQLIADYLAGREVLPRVASEVHGDDLAAAVLLLLRQPAPPRSVNVSDLTLDHHDLLGTVKDLTGCRHPLPPRSDASALRILQPTALRAMGWQPGGMPLLRRTIQTHLDGQDRPS